MASSIMKSPTAAGTRRPLAIVFAFGNKFGEALALFEARTIGAQPSALAT